MTTSEDGKARTSICGYDADTIVIRGRDLVDGLIGHSSFVEAFLLQALGKDPEPASVHIVDAVMVTIMEHGLVPSAIVSRLTHYGAPESYQGAIAAGLLGVGDRYAGTAGECGELLERLVAAGNVESEATAIVREYRAVRRPLPGFGHPIHRDNDPRVERLISVVREAGTAGKHIDAMYTLEAAISKELNRTLVTNISAAIGAALAEAGIPSAMMRGIVLTARCAGLVGHLHEESQRPIAHAMWEGAQESVVYGE